MFDDHFIANLFQLFVGADHARDSRACQYVSCILNAIYFGIVHWFMVKQTCVMTHSTDADIQPYYPVAMIN